MTSDTDALCAKLTCTHRALTKVDSTTRNESRTCYLPTCRQYRARTASPRPDLGMRGWTAAPHQESPSAASRQAFCRRGARRRNQACEKVRTDRYRYAAPPDAYPCASIPCIGHSSRCRSLTLSALEALWQALNSFSQMGSHPSFLIGKLCRSAFSLILARSFWTGRDVSSAEVRGLQESLARLPSPFEVPIARKEEPDDADKAFTTSLIHLLRTSRKSAVTRSMRSEGPCKLAEASGTFG